MIMDMRYMFFKELLLVDVFEYVIVLSTIWT